MMKSILLFLVVVALSCTTISGKEQFEEKLLIKQVDEGKFLFHFSFETTLTLDQNNDVIDYQLFPKSFGQILQKLQVENLRLTFAQGRWWNTWGQPILSSPPGVALAARFINETQHSIETSNWLELASALSGLFCASLGRLDKTSTAYLNDLDGGVWYGALPRETVCTENLTPWMKLLPCRSKIGLAALLNSTEIYDVEYHGMSAEFKLTSTKENEKVFQLIQGVDIVFPVQREWSFESIFGVKTISSCPLSKSTTVFVEGDSKNYQPSPHSAEGSPFRYSISEEPFSLEFSSSDSRHSPLTSPSLVDYERYVIGSGDITGGIVTHVKNVGQSPIVLGYFEIIPWYLRIYFHTLKLSIDGEKITPEVRNLEGAIDHNRPSIIELEFELKPKSEAIITYTFEKAFLHWTEFPPDAHRGFDISGPILRISEAGNRKTPKEKEEHILHTRPLLIAFPTPDFSMPYNVVTLTGTVVALFFGSVLNVLVRRMKNLDRVGDDFLSNRPIARALRKIFALMEGGE